MKCPYQMPSTKHSSDRYLITVIAVKCHALRGSVSEKDHHGGLAGHRRFRSEDAAVRFWLRLTEGTAVCWHRRAQVPAASCDGYEARIQQQHAIETRVDVHQTTSPSPHVRARGAGGVSLVMRRDKPASHARVHRSNTRYTRFAVSWG